MRKHGRLRRQTWSLFCNILGLPEVHMYLDFSLAAFEEITHCKLYIFKLVNWFDFASEYLCMQLRNIEVVLMMQKVIPAL